MKKAILLFLALLLPVAVFVFLKFFGKNEFEVPVLFADGVLTPPAGCTKEYSKPYLLDSGFMSTVRSGTAELYFIPFAVDPAVLNRIGEESSDALVLVKPAVVSQDEVQVRNCTLLMPSDADLALIDKQGRIRGHYNSKKIEEVDRLIMEVKIILKEY